MSKIKLFFSSFIIVFAITSILFAAEEMESKKPKVRQITGDIIKLDLKTGYITVKSKRQEVAMSMDENTKVWLKRVKKEITDLNIGDRVRAKYIQIEGKNIAKSISIRSSTTEAIK